MAREIIVKRETKETQVNLTLDMDRKTEPFIDIEGIPFFNHLIHAMTFHGGFFIDVKATGDVDVDPHHLVEDIGLVLGDALLKTVKDFGPVHRFAHSIIPMDDALSEVTIDAAGRSFLVYNADFPQEYAGEFPLCLIAEFLTALTARAKITLHAECKYGNNSHHMAECLFKALGKAIGKAFSAYSGEKGPLSTKGNL